METAAFAPPPFPAKACRAERRNWFRAHAGRQWATKWRNAGFWRTAHEAATRFRAAKLRRLLAQKEAQSKPLPYRVKEQTAKARAGLFQRVGNLFRKSRGRG